MISPSTSLRVRRLGLGLLMLAVSACGLSDYETLMHEAQEREDRFREEQKHLGEMVQIPMQKTKDNQFAALAEVFFRPPKGIDTKARQHSDVLWRYLPGPLAPGAQPGDFLYVDLAFADEDKGFANKVVESYNPPNQPTQSTRQVTAPGQLLPLNFEVWKFNKSQDSYSVNILKGSRKPFGIVYVFKKAKSDSALKAIDLSLQSLAVDQQLLTARLRYQRRTPWILDKQPGS